MAEIYCCIKLNSVKGRNFNTIKSYVFTYELLLSLTFLSPALPQNIYFGLLLHNKPLHMVRNMGDGLTVLD